MQKAQSKISGELRLILAAVFFSFNGVVAKWVLLTGISSMRLTEVRTLGVATLLGTYLLLRKPKDIKVERTLLKRLIIFGVIGGLLLVILFSFFLYSRFRITSRQKTARTLTTNPTC